MSEQEKNVQVEEQEQADDIQNSEAKSEVAELKELLTAQQETYKAELAGLNRKISELTSEKKAVEESKLSDVERLQKQIDEISQKAKKAELDKLKIEAASASGLDHEYLAIEAIDDPVDRIAKMGEYIASIKASAEEKKADEFAKSLGTKPKASGSTVSVVPKTLADCKTKEERKAYLNAKRNE